MTDYTNGIVIEARKKGLRQSRDAKGDWYDVTFQIHPDDAISDLAKLPLGARVGLVITLLQDAETSADEHSTPEATETPEEPERPKGGARAKRAGILCGDAAFQNWYINRNHASYRSNWPSWSDTEVAADLLRNECDIKSRTWLDHPDYKESARIFDQIVADFEHAQRGGDEGLTRQAAVGPG